MARTNTRLIGLAILLAVEIVGGILFFQVFSDFECRNTSAEAACRAVRSGALRGFSVTAGLALFLWLRTALRRQLVQAVATRNGGLGWLAVHGAGLVLAFVPWALADLTTLEAQATRHLILLALGGMVAAVGGVFFAIAPTDLRALLAKAGAGLWFVIVLAAVIPDLADAIGIAWTVDAVLGTTFIGVVLFLTAAGSRVTYEFAPPSIGADGFIVEIADSCSGVEGFALITGFLAIYSVLMHGAVRQRRLWLVIWPAAIIASWLFNILRIGVLLLIGSRVSPELAVNGFHSFAGWMFFTILALGILMLVPSIGWLQRPAMAGGAALAGHGAGGDEPAAPLTRDWGAARIVPFIAFMLSGMVASALWLHPELAYPAQMIAVAAIIWLFRKGLGRLWDGVDPFAIAGGLVIAGFWIVFHTPGDDSLPGLATLGPAALALWVAVRMVGTTVVVPIVEEAFFRGYLMTRLDFGGWLGKVVAVAISTACFAALHGRIIEAALSGLIFALVMMRRGRLGDAILAHAVANGLIALAALGLGDWSLI